MDNSNPTAKKSSFDIRRKFIDLYKKGPEAIQAYVDHNTSTLEARAKANKERHDELMRSMGKYPTDVIPPPTLKMFESRYLDECVKQFREEAEAEMEKEKAEKEVQAKIYELTSKNGNKVE